MFRSAWISCVGFSMDPWQTSRRMISALNLSPALYDRRSSCFDVCQQISFPFVGRSSGFWAGSCWASRIWRRRGENASRAQVLNCGIDFFRGQARWVGCLFARLPMAVAEALSSPRTSTAFRVKLAGFDFAAATIQCGEGFAVDKAPWHRLRPQSPRH